MPNALEGRKVPLCMAEAKLGVPGRLSVGEVTRFAPPANIEPGRARREGDRPVEGKGEDDRGGGPEPVYFFCVRIREKIA